MDDGVHQRPQNARPVRMDAHQPDDQRQRRRHDATTRDTNHSADPMRAKATLTATATGRQRTIDRLVAAGDNRFGKTVRDRIPGDRRRGVVRRSENDER
jgi:hypothetical protein